MRRGLLFYYLHCFPLTLATYDCSLYHSGCSLYNKGCSLYDSGCLGNSESVRLLRGRSDYDVLLFAVLWASFEKLYFLYGSGWGRGNDGLEMRDWVGECFPWPCKVMLLLWDGADLKVDSGRWCYGWLSEIVSDNSLGGYNIPLNKMVSLVAFPHIWWPKDYIIDPWAVQVVMDRYTAHGYVCVTVLNVTYWGGGNILWYEVACW
jgi:hypothetical protein